MVKKRSNALLNESNKKKIKTEENENVEASDSFFHNIQEKVNIKVDDPSKGDF